MEVGTKLRTITIVTIAIAIQLGSVSSLSAQPTILIVRHAEKVETWPGGILDAYHPLSATGVARAESLATVFGLDEIAGIYGSRTTRTVHTGLPLSQKLGLPIMEATACQDTSRILDFFGEVIRNHRSDQNVLLISHSDVIPHLLLKAGLPDSCWQEQGITGSPGTELLIEGYSNIWRVDLSRSLSGGCEGFSRTNYWVRSAESVGTGK